MLLINLTFPLKPLMLLPPQLLMKAAKVMACLKPCLEATLYLMRVRISTQD
ncbi:hypothetical protein N9K75_00565 [bacterium]|nr:hypothetical protein [bacterium]